VLGWLLDWCESVWLPLGEDEHVLELLLVAVVREWRFLAGVDHGVMEIEAYLFEEECLAEAVAGLTAVFGLVANYPNDDSTGLGDAVQSACDGFKVKGIAVVGTKAVVWWGSYSQINAISGKLFQLLSRIPRYQVARWHGILILTLCRDDREGWGVKPTSQIP